MSTAGERAREHLRASSGLHPSALIAARLGQELGVLDEGVGEQSGDLAALRSRQYPQGRRSEDGARVSVDHHRARRSRTAAATRDRPDARKCGLEAAEDIWVAGAPGMAHNMVVRALTRVLDQAAAADGGSSLYVNGEIDVAILDGVRRPDVIVMRDQDAFSAARLGRSRLDAPDILLVAEVVSRRSGSERQDRKWKLIDYALAGIPQYWIVDFDPVPEVQVHILDESAYRLDRTVIAGGTVSITEPLKVSFDPAVLTPWRGHDSVE